MLSFSVGCFLSFSAQKPPALRGWQSISFTWSQREAAAKRQRRVWARGDPCSLYIPELFLTTASMLITEFPLSDAQEAHLALFPANIQPWLTKSLRTTGLRLLGSIKKNWQLFKPWQKTFENSGFPPANVWGSYISDKLDWNSTKHSYVNSLFSAFALLIVQTLFIVISLGGKIFLYFSRDGL